MATGRILNELYKRESSKIKLGLKNIRTLLGKIGNPEKSLKCIHVAGTNGKGSVCAMLFYILREAEYNVGLYTSPHLKKFNERIRANDKMISDHEIAEYYLKLKPFITNQSFFEITTAMAFIYFKKENVDFVILEVGLGGRLDATNVVVPLISVITNVSMEHTDILGKTVEKIAFEKAGIIKENVPVVTGCTGKSLEAVRKISAEKGSRLFSAKKYPRVNFKHLLGKYQQTNKDIALTAIDILKKNRVINIEDNKIISGIQKTKWPGRLQFLEKNVLVDCAHNPEGISALVKELRNFKYKRLIMVLGFSQDKNIEEMAKIVKLYGDFFIITKSNNKKAANPRMINQHIQQNSMIVENPKKALAYAKKVAKRNDLILVTGSIYVIGDII